jgi:putative transposase
MALGFWKGFWTAVREVFSATREQRCWFHKASQCSCRTVEIREPGGDRGRA